jgi:hypothetical protein
MIMFGRKSKGQLNLLELVPERRWGHSLDEAGRVVVDMPRFHVAWMQRWLVPRGKSPFIRVKLDEFGSHVWLLCDGATPIGAIADSLVQRFGDSVQPVHDRLTVFFRQLRERGFISLRKPDGSIV